MPSKSAKATAPVANSTTSGKKKPKNLDRLIIPGMSQNVPGYDGGVPGWLSSSGLTVRVDKNWAASAGDTIIIADISNPAAIRPLDTKKLVEGEQLQNVFFRTLSKDVLPDGEYKLGYVVQYSGTKDSDMSAPLHVRIKSDEPGGPDSGYPPSGHPALKFSLSELEIYPPQAARGVVATIEPYPNMHADDTIYLLWGSVMITQKVTGVGQRTEINVSYAQIVEAGDGYDLLVGFHPVDLVGNVSKRRSPDLKVLVDINQSLPDGPGFITNDPVGYIDLERLAGEKLELELYTSSSVGMRGAVYDIMFRAYPPLGGVVVYRAFEEILRAGTPISHFVPYSIVRAAAGGKVEARFTLMRTQEPYEIISKKTSAQVVGSIVRLDAPYFENYPLHEINPIPDSAVVVIPWYEWRRPTDEITLILRFVKSLNDTIVYSETRQVGPSWPNGAPVKRLIYRDALERFKGYKPELYYVYRSAMVRASSADLNESLRQAVQIG